MTHVREAITAATATLAQAGIDSARTDAELLAAHVAGTERGRLGLLDAPEPGFFDLFGRAVAARARRIPLQHITGVAAFGPVLLHVGPGVFIPRPETEALLEWALSQSLPRAAVIVDLCTGSGALAIALASQRPEARVIAVDDDADALDYAQRNVMHTTVQLVCGDVTDVGLLSELVGSVDLVVANPPYLPAGSALDPEVARHDPAHALFGGPDGMAVIGPLVANAARWLKPGGLLAVEHDDTTAEATAEVINATGAFGDVTAHRDLTGRPRFVTARATYGE
jgi:release factor glutamine methyltransferase